MNCWRCGVFIPEGAQACSNCGASLEQSAGAPVPPPGFFTAVPPEPLPAIPDVPPMAPGSVITSPDQLFVNSEPVATVSESAESVPGLISEVPDQLSVAPEPVASGGYENAPFPFGAAGDSVQQADSAPSYIPPPYQASAFDSTGAVPPLNKTKKKFWRPTTIAATVILAFVLGIGGYGAYGAYREYVCSITYEEALTLMNQEEYPLALEKFSSLEGYRDASDQAWYCTQVITYGEAKSLLEAKDYKGAYDAFEMLGAFRDSEEYVKICGAWQAFEEAVVLTEEGSYEDAQKKGESIVTITKVWDDPKVKEWRKKNDYALADRAFSNGAFYEAYVRFTLLVKQYGEYEDASARAEACVQPMPGNTVLYHNERFYSSSTDVTFNAGDSQQPHYLKIYSGDTLVATLFVTPAASTTIQLPAGDYIIKEAVGDKWFGETDIFGVEGFYCVVSFDGVSSVFPLAGNMIYDITFYGPLVLVFWIER